MIAQSLSTELANKELHCVCGGKLECFWQRQSIIKGATGEILHGPGIFRIYHPRNTCKYRFEIFGEGKDQADAWEEARNTVSNHTNE